MIFDGTQCADDIVQKRRALMMSRMVIMMEWRDGDGRWHTDGDGDDILMVMAMAQ